MILNLLISRIAVVRLGMNHWYGLALLPASLAFIARMDTVRPQALSSSLLILLFSALISESKWLALLTAAAIGFLHPTLSYLIIIIGLGTFIQRGISQKQWNCWIELSCLVIAISVDCIRPGIVDGLQLLKVQLWDLMIVRRAGEVKNFGVELDRVSISYFKRAMLSPIILVIISTICFFRFRSKEQKDTAIWGLLAVVGASLLISLAVTKRGADQFAPFAVLTALYIFNQCKGITRFMAITFALHGVLITSLFIQSNFERHDRINATDYKAGAEWLASHTQPGEIVGQGVWSDFGPLFFWNPRNRYLGGMDPVFQYRFNPETYWLITISCSGRDLGKTSKYNPIRVFDKEEEISTAWPRDLKTKWLFCATDWNPEIQAELKKDPNTRIAFRDSHAIVYEFMPTIQSMK